MKTTKSLLVGLLLSVGIALAACGGTEADCCPHTGECVEISTHEATKGAACRNCHLSEKAPLAGPAAAFNAQQ